MPRKRRNGASSGRYVGYLRVSTDGQAESGLGLMDQRLMVKERVERLKGKLVGIHADEGRSGSLPVSKRPGLMAALESLGEGDTLVVARRDRLARDTLLVMMIERDLATRGCRVLSASGEGTDDDSPESKLMRHFIDAIAEYQRLVTKMRTTNALAIKRSRNEYTGGQPPFGWDVEERDGTAMLVENAAEQRALREIGAIRSRGGSWQDVADTLNRLGVRTKTGRPWCRERAFLSYGQATRRAVHS